MLPPQFNMDESKEKETESVKELFVRSFGRILNSSRLIGKILLKEEYFFVNLSVLSGIVM